MIARNGGEGFLSPHLYVRLSRIEELPALNDRFTAHEPGFILFGRDLDDEVFALDVRQEPPMIVALSAIGMNAEDALPVGSVASFLAGEHGDPFPRGRYG